MTGRNHETADAASNARGNGDLLAMTFAGDDSSTRAPAGVADLDARDA